MKQVKVLGAGCPKCRQLLQQTQQAALELGLECHIEKITEIQDISAYGVMMTPALVVDGVVKVTGRVPSMNELKAMLS
jgi:small redox-active disulfide protein 2